MFGNWGLNINNLYSYHCMSNLFGNFFNPYLYSPTPIAGYNNLISTNFAQTPAQSPISIWSPGVNADDIRNNPFNYFTSDTMGATIGKVTNVPKKRVKDDAPITGQTVKIPRSKIVDIACEKAKKYNIDERLVLAVINAECGFKPRASKKGAQGYMQLMPDTARGLGVTNIHDPEQNIEAGVKYLRQMLNKYNGNIKMALAAYNWGPANLDKKGFANRPGETRKYVDNVYNSYKNIKIT